MTQWPLVSAENKPSCLLNILTKSEKITPKVSISNCDFMGQDQHNFFLKKVIFKFQNRVKCLNLINAIFVILFFFFCFHSHDIESHLESHFALP